MFAIVPCPKCNHEQEVPEEAFGKEFDCRACTAHFVVPDPFAKDSVPLSIEEQRLASDVQAQEQSLPVSTDEWDAPATPIQPGFNPEGKLLRRDMANWEYVRYGLTWIRLSLLIAIVFPVLGFISLPAAFIYSYGTPVSYVSSLAGHIICVFIVVMPASFGIRIVGRMFLVAAPFTTHSRASAIVAVACDLSMTLYVLTLCAANLAGSKWGMLFFYALPMILALISEFAAIRCLRKIGDALGSDDSVDRAKSLNRIVWTGAAVWMALHVVLAAVALEILDTEDSRFFARLMEYFLLTWVCFLVLLAFYIPRCLRLVSNIKDVIVTASHAGQRYVD